jgi:glycosyltransferase involved in cell wall biosynthesis
MNNRKPKVLVVATSRLTRGGITSVVKAHESGAQWKEYNCKWIETHRDGSSLQKIKYLLTAFVSYIFLLPFYDVVHIHVGLRTSITRKMLFAKLAKCYNKKIIIHFHPATEKHLFDENFNKSIFDLFKLSDKLLVLSLQWIRWINEAYPNNKFNFQILYNPCPEVIRNKENEKPYILFAGTLNERKGYNKLIKAFAQIAHDNSTWRLKFAGNGEIKEAKQLAKDLSVESKIDFLGWISGNLKDKIFNEAAIYCLPSWGEGFPMGVLDAIAYGVPVVTTPVGGIPDIIKSGENGYIFDTNDLDNLAKQLTVLMNSKEERKAIVKQADKLLRNEFNLEKINHNLSLIYEDLMNEK